MFSFNFPFLSAFIARLTNVNY